MPYITKDRRSHIDCHVDQIINYVDNDGDLNYAITRLLHLFVKKSKLCYHTINIVQGVIDCVGREFYRRVAAPYEDNKINENGDIGIL